MGNAFAWLKIHKIGYDQKVCLGVIIAQILIANAKFEDKMYFVHIFSPIYFFTYFFSEIYSFLNVKLYLEVLSKNKIVFLLGDLENVQKHLHTKSRQKKNKWG